MKNTFGNNISVTLFGESHGDAIGCVIDGLAPGIKIDPAYVSRALMQRAARSDISTPRVERDEPVFLSGVKNGITEGTPVCIIIRNENVNSSSYSDYEFTPRPSHADLTAEYKYHGYQDKAGGGHFSGRITAPLVAAGAIIRCALENLGIKIGTHIKSLHGICDREFGNYDADVELLNTSSFPALDSERAEKMKEEILNAKEKLDSVGGVLETVITGMPAGVGEPWFDTVEGVISHAVFSVPAVKGIEFGDGFKIAEEDLTLRGAGEILGTKQSGMPEFKIADLSTDQNLLKMAYNDAKYIMNIDPELTSERGRALRLLLYLFHKDEAVKTLKAG